MTALKSADVKGPNGLPDRINVEPDVVLIMVKFRPLRSQTTTLQSLFQRRANGVAIFNEFVSRCVQICEAGYAHDCLRHMPHKKP